MCTLCSLDLHAEAVSSNRNTVQTNTNNKVSASVQINSISCDRCLHKANHMYMYMYDLQSYSPMWLQGHYMLTHLQLIQIRWRHLNPVPQLDWSNWRLHRLHVCTQNICRYIQRHNPSVAKMIIRPDHYMYTLVYLYISTQHSSKFAYPVLVAHLYQ